MMIMRRHVVLAAALLTTSALLSPRTAVAFATQDQVESFNIPAGPLPEALTQFGAQSRLQLMYTPDLVRTSRTAGVQGRMSAYTALDRLLAGTGLAWLQSQPGVVVLRHQDEAVRTSNETPATMLDEVIVTGTHIRGARTTASPLTTLSRDGMDRQGHASVADALSALPQNYSGSGTPVGLLTSSDPIRTNVGLATGINLRGLGTDATLVLVNGRRLAGTGTQGDFADVSSIPMAATERVDVLLDGASALYGSDAVGGVVNVILRRDFIGQETRVRLGAATGGAEEMMFAHTAGWRWQDGHALLSYEYQEQGALNSADRAYARTGDLRPFGGTDHRQYYAFPGNIVGYDFTTAAYATLWAIRPQTDGSVAFIPGAQNLGFRLQGTDLIPHQTRNSVYGLVRQAVSERVELSFDIRATERNFDYALIPPASIITVTSANPFFASPIGSASHQVAYDFSRELGASRRDGSSRSLGLSAGVDVDLSRGWRLEAYAAYASEQAKSLQSVMLNSAYLNEALGRTPDNPSTAYSATRDGYLNLFGRPNSLAVLEFISSGYSRSVDESDTQSLNLTLQGPIADLPAGEARAAFGVQIRSESLSGSYEDFLYSTTPEVSAGTDYERRSAAAFVEARIPIFSAENRRPGLERLELSLAARFEDYDDVGSTTNPKVGVIWDPVSDVQLRTTWGTSFRAPPLTAVFGRYYISAVDVPDGPMSRLALLEVGGNPDLKPETAETLTLGVDFTPRWAKGLKISLTGFDTRFEDRIGRPGLENYAQVLNDPNLAAFVAVLDPAVPADRTRIETLINDPAFLLAGLYPANAFTAVVDGRWINAAEVHVRGMDAAISYGFQQGGNDFRIDASGSLLFDYERKLSPTAQGVDRVGQVGYPVDFRGILSAEWTRGTVSSRIGLNYVSDYRDALGGAIDAWTTLDLQLRWTPDSGLLEGVQAAFNIHNLLDEDPPFYDAPSGIGFDPGQANPLGRTVSFQLTKRW